MRPPSLPITSSASSMATLICTRAPDSWTSAIPRRMFSSVRSPNPRRPFRRPASIAAASSSTEEMPRSRYRSIAFFGPRPEIAIIWRTPDGTAARRSSSAAKVPVRSASSTLPAVDLPTLGIALERKSTKPPTSTGPAGLFCEVARLLGPNTSTDWPAPVSPAKVVTWSFLPTSPAAMVTE